MLASAGAQPETKARNRQELYDTSKALEQAAKKSLHGQGKGQKKAKAIPNGKPVRDGHSKEQQGVKGRHGPIV